MAYLYEEMRQSFLSGHDHATIVTACALLEYTLKSAVFAEHHLKNGRKFDRAKWDLIDGMTTEQIIKHAGTVGIVDKSLKKRLISFNNTIRKQYMHGSTPAGLKDHKMSVLQASLITGDVGRVSIDVGDDIVMQRMLRVTLDRDACEHVVRFVFVVVQFLADQKHAKVTEWKSRNAPFVPTVEQMKRAADNLENAGIGNAIGIVAEFPSLKDLESFNEPTEGAEG